MMAPEILSDCWATRTYSNCRRVLVSDCMSAYLRVRRVRYPTHSSRACRLWCCKEASDFRGEKIHQQCTGDRKPDATSNDVTAQKIDEISQDLRCDNSNRQYPSPVTASEPPDARGNHRCA